MVRPVTYGEYIQILTIIGIRSFKLCTSRDISDDHVLTYAEESGVRAFIKSQL